MHLLVIDSETGDTVIDADVEAEQTVEAGPSHTGAPAPGSRVRGYVYKDVVAWIGAKTLVHPYEEADLAVFISWVDESTTDQVEVNPGVRHTVERPLPGGGVGRFLITAG